MNSITPEIAASLQCAYDSMIAVNSPARSSFSQGPVTFEISSKIIDGKKRIDLRIEESLPLERTARMNLSGMDRMYKYVCAEGDELTMVFGKLKIGIKIEKKV